MRKPEIIQEQIKHLDLLTNKAIRAAELYPDDFALKLIIDQDEHIKSHLVSELQQSYVSRRSHVLSYIFKTGKGECMDLDPLLSGLTAFRDLVSKTAQNICGRPIPLGFGTIFEGSFGVMFNTPHDGGLIDTDYQRTFSKVFHVIEALSEENADVKQVIQKNIGNNKRVTKKFSKLFEDITDSNRAVEITWCDIDGVEKRLGITVAKAKWLHDSFMEHDRRAPEVLELSGSIKGMSLVSNKIEFQYSRQGQKKPAILKANFPIEMLDQVKSNFDKKITATFQVDIEYNDVTDEEIPRRTLLSIN